MDTTNIKIVRLLTFEQSFRYRIEKLVFDASDSLDNTPASRNSSYAVLPKAGFRRVNAQLKTLYRELGVLIVDLNVYATI